MLRSPQRFWRRHFGYPQQTNKKARRRELCVENLERRELLSSSLVAAYSFDQGSGTTLVDTSGNGNNGTISGATWSSGGKFGDALQFTGNTGCYVTVNDSSSLNLTSGMTLEAWVDPSSLSSPASGWLAVIAKEHVNSSNNICYALYGGSGTGNGPSGHVLIGSRDYGGALAASQLALNTWTFLAATYNGSIIKLYVNGALAASQSASGKIFTTSDPLRIGGDAAGEMFTGLIDNVRIYNRALTATQITTDMTTPAAPTVASVTPANGATNVATSTTVTVTFSEAVKASTVSTSTFYFTDPSGHTVAASVSYNATTHVAMLTPTSTLANSTAYTATALGGTSGITDGSGNPMVNNYVWTLTTTAASSGLTISPTTLSNATANSAYSATISASGGSGTYTFAVTAGSLPSWLTLNGSTGVLSGTATTTGSSTFTITATDSHTSGLTGSQAYTLTVIAASSLTLAPVTLGNATANSAYSATISATGGSGTYTFAVTNGNLPSWLTLNGTTGLLSGTPTTMGSSSFAITATDAHTSSLTGSQAYTLTVNAASSLTVAPATLANATVNTAYSATLSATGGSGTYTFAVTTGTLPSWLTLNATTGVLSGTPSATGTSNFTITATDAANSSLTGSQAYALTVNSATPVFPNNVNAPALPPPTGTIVNVSTASQLQSAVANLQSGQTILITAGTYNLTDTLWVPQNISNISIRGATGNAADVIVKGDAVLDETAPYSGSAIWGPGSGISGTIKFGIWIGNVQGATIGDLTLENYIEDAIILNAGVQSPLIHNVTMIDVGEQFIKSNPDGSGGGVNNGIVEYCNMEYTTAAPNNYTDGVDLHTTQNWIIRDNVFKNIYTTNPLVIYGVGALAGPAVLVWDSSSNCTTQANTFIDCQREIAYGLSSPSQITDDNTGGLIDNNFIYRSGTQHGDVGIGIWNSPNTEAAYNTVILNGDYVNAIEYRFSTTTGVKILYNLTDAAITERDGASGTVTGNVTNAQSSWFVNESIGNLNLTSAATGAIGQGVYLSAVPTDYNGLARPSTGPTDVGAAQYQAAVVSRLGKAGSDRAPTAASRPSIGSGKLISSWSAVEAKLAMLSSGKRSRDWIFSFEW
jgi:hypothetical protein